jgi:hypothetical protein
MKIPPLLPIDDDTVIVLDDVYTVTWSGFLKVNAFAPEEIDEMRRALHETGEYRGGGGAAREFHVTFLRHWVIETKLHELRRIRIDESVLFEGIEPEQIADEIARIAGALDRTFVIGGVKLGTRIWRTA